MTCARLTHSPPVSPPDLLTCNRAYCSASGQGGDAARALLRKLGAHEAAAAQRLCDAVARGASELGAWALAAAALAQHALRGRRFSTSAWAAASLWLLLLLSELRLMNQVRPARGADTLARGAASTRVRVCGSAKRAPRCCRCAARSAATQTLLAMLAYACLFVLPWSCHAFRPAMDAALSEALVLLTALLTHAERWAYVAAAAAAAGVWQLTEPGAGGAGGGSLVVRCSAAAGAALCVLAWRLARA